MRQNYSIVLLVLLMGCSIRPGAPKATSNNNTEYIQQLALDFVKPPMSTRPGAFWCWLNGDVTNASITRDLEEMKQKGMGSADIYDLAAMNNPDGAYGTGPQFLGDESVKSIRHALSEGKRLGIKLGLVGSSGWNAGGSWVTPDWAAKALYSSVLKIKGPLSFSGALPFPKVPKECPKDRNGVPVYFREIAVLAIPDHAEKKIARLSDIVVLNKKFDGKELKWEVPEGNWTLIRYVCTNTGQHLIIPSPNSNGLFIDFLDPNATKRHLKYILDRLGITPQNAASVGLDNIEFDSMEMDEATPWTNAMDSIFLAQNGYDILRHLPAFDGWNLPEGNDRFLYDFKKTVSNQLIYSHYATGRDFLATYGMKLVAEAGGPGPPVWNSCPVDALKALGNVSVPRGEFWIRNRYNIFLVKEVASASHIYGLDIVDAESFTTWRRWKDAPHELKKYVDRAFCEGLNAVTFHAFGNTRPEFGLPGRAYHAGTDINPTATWWEMAYPFMDYLARCSFMLRQGKFVADVAYYYGDKAPNFFPELQGGPPQRLGLKGLGFGYDFDVVNTDVLLNRMQVSEGKIVLPDGLNYKLLVIPDRKDIPVEVVKKLEQLIAKGANVLIQNPVIANSINGKVFRNMSIDEALAGLTITKDFSGDVDKLDFIHRKKDNTDIYFVRNRTDQPISEEVEFRAMSENPEFWDPVTSRQFAIKDARISNGRTSIRLQLPANGSCFIIFNTRSRQLPDYPNSTGSSPVELKGPWSVSFPEKWGAPPSVEFNDLISWTDHPNDGVKYFSGTATYIKSLNISKEAIDQKRPITLDLGNVLDVAEVFVNSKSAGTIWTKPFRVDIQDYVKEGRNDLQIKVANMWINRLAGDMLLPPDKRFCRTNQPFVTKDRTAWGDETFRIQKAGLIGPVTITQQQ
jgi:hypothetical protein